MRWVSRPPLENLGKILEGGKEEKGKGEGKRGGNGKEKQGKKGKMERKRREIIKGKEGEEENLKMEGGKVRK